MRGAERQLRVQIAAVERARIQRALASVRHEREKRVDRSAVAANEGDLFGAALRAVCVGRKRGSAPVLVQANCVCDRKYSKPFKSDEI